LADGLPPHPRYRRTTSHQDKSNAFQQTGTSRTPRSCRFVSMGVDASANMTLRQFSDITHATVDQHTLNLVIQRKPSPGCCRRHTERWQQGRPLAIRAPHNGAGVHSARCVTFTCVAHITSCKHQQLSCHRNSRQGLAVGAGHNS
jgi:hypothetical protein